MSMCSIGHSVRQGAITTAPDTAYDDAAFTLMPAVAEVLTIEVKTNLLAPARPDSS